MISLDLARRLHDAGLPWSPRNGDRFWLPERELDQPIFTVSDMVVEVRDLPAGRVLAFNGTTEWALDAVEDHEAVWLPRLEQLLQILGPAFLSLTARSGGHVVRVAQIRHRKNKGSRGGRPVAFDTSDYKHRNVVERAFNHMKNWRGLATRYDKHAVVFRGGVVSPPSCSGGHDFRDTS